MPTTDDMMSCVLEPLRRADLPGVLFLDHQWDALVEAFPTGVCDWTKPDPNAVETVPWLTYAGGPGGQPLGEPPASAPVSQDRPTVSFEVDDFDRSEETGWSVLVEDVAAETSWRSPLTGRNRPHRRRSTCQSLLADVQ